MADTQPGAAPRNDCTAIMHCITKTTRITVDPLYGLLDTVQKNSLYRPHQKRENTKKTKHFYYNQTTTYTSKKKKILIPECRQ
jgi:hypothetical protein